MAKKSQLAVAVSESVKDELQKVADKWQSDSGQNVYVSDVVRHAIEEFLKSEGIDIEVSVNRGGDRVSKKWKNR